MGIGIFARPIPYHKELRSLAGSISATILLQQLEYWFERSGDGFYKFVAPCEHSNYRDGDSWCEELAFSDDEWRSAFDKIGVRHASKTQFIKSQATGSQFLSKSGKEMLYCSYCDRTKGKTYYFRNHTYCDRAFSELLKVGVATEVKIADTSSVLEDKLPQQAAPVPVSTPAPNQVAPAPAPTPNQVAPTPTPAPVSTPAPTPNQVAPGDLKPINDISDLAIAPNGKYIYPWENQGASRNNQFNWTFAEWLYEEKLKNYTGAFNREGFAKNKINVAQYLRKAHSDEQRREALIDSWNEWVELSKPKDSTSQLTALSTFSPALREIVISHEFSSELIAEIAGIVKIMNSNFAIHWLAQKGLIDISYANRTF